MDGAGSLGYEPGAVCQTWGERGYGRNGHTSNQITDQWARRRLPFMNVSRVNQGSHAQLQGPDSSGDELDPDLHDDFLGENMVLSFYPLKRSLANYFLQASQMFEKSLKGIYDPELHWTSDLRSRAGFKSTISGDGSPFTFSGHKATDAVTDLLIQNGVSQTALWRDTIMTYHFEIAASTGNRSSAFIWGTAQIERVSSPQARVMLQCRLVLFV